MQLFENIQDEIISRINKSTCSLKIAITWFTNHDIFEAVLNKLSEANFKVHLIVLNDGINNKIEGLNFQNFIDRGGVFYYSEDNSVVHHKFCIIDDKIVITGSYNWTYTAELKNWENIVILNDLKIVKGFIDEFENKILNLNAQVINLHQQPCET